MFETIVWASDGSALADRALEQVTAIATAHGSRIVAVHVDELLHGRFGVAPILLEEPRLRAKIEGQVSELQAQGFDVELEVETGGGPVHELIARAAEEAGADLIVVGTHGYGAIASAFLGSVAKGLLHVAPCPVLAIPPLHGATKEVAAA